MTSDAVLIGSHTEQTENGYLSSSNIESDTLIRFILNMVDFNLLEYCNES